MPKVSAKDVVQTGRCPFPYDAYHLRIVDAKFAPSKKGNPMTTLSIEIVGKRDGSSEVEVDGAKFDIKGQTFNVYLIYTQDGPDPESGEFKRGQLGNVIKFNDKLKVEMDEIDTDNPDIAPYLGIEFLAMCEGKRDVLRGPDRKPVLDGEGKEVPGNVQVNLYFDNIIGPIGKANVAY